MHNLPKIVKNSKETLQAELRQIELALRSDKISPEIYRQLYAAQQALTWAIDPNVAAPPYDVIITGKVRALMDIPV